MPAETPDNGSMGSADFGCCSALAAYSGDLHNSGFVGLGESILPKSSPTWRVALPDRSARTEDADGQVDHRFS